MPNSNNFISADLINAWAKSSLNEFENKYPLFKSLMKNSKSKIPAVEWDIYIIASCCGILLTMEKNIDENIAIKEALNNLGENYIKALNEFREFNKNCNLNHKDKNEIWEKLGIWILKNIKKDSLTFLEEDKLSLPLGNLVKLISFSSSGAIKIENNDRKITEKNIDSPSISSNKVKRIIIMVGLSLLGLYMFNILREPSEFECMKLGSDDARDICMEEYHPTNGKKYYWSKNLYNENR